MAAPEQEQGKDSEDSRTLREIFILLSHRINDLVKDSGQSLHQVAEKKSAAKYRNQKALSFPLPSNSARSNPIHGVESKGTSTSPPQTPIELSSIQEEAASMNHKQMEVIQEQNLKLLKEIISLQQKLQDVSAKLFSLFIHFDIFYHDM